MVKEEEKTHKDAFFWLPNFQGERLHFPIYLDNGKSDFGKISHSHSVPLQDLPLLYFNVINLNVMGVKLDEI